MKVGFEVLTAVTKKNAVFSCRLHIQGGDTFLRNVGSYKTRLRHFPEDGILPA
jgi:hypothetical protein